MHRRTAPSIPACSVWITAALLALVFALCTHHAWEDYWITFRASKNLATGNGLVFQVGERVHSFTSPLGVLLPALASLVTGNHSDDAALWLFRVISIAAFATAVTLLLQCCRSLRWHRWATFFAVAWAMTDLKSLDYTINGMETGLMLCFLSYTLWSMLACDSRQWLHLGLAWAGVMWTRPDGFLYIGLLAFGMWAFKPGSLTRREIFMLFLRAGLVCTVLYLPWFVFAWLYYGSPVPNTILAKAASVPPRTLAGALTALGNIPRTCWHFLSPQSMLLLPAYCFSGGWSLGMGTLAAWISSVGLLLWPLPKVNRVTRVVSFAGFALSWYLGYMAPYPAGWYCPPVAWLIVVSYAGLLAQLWASSVNPFSPQRICAVAVSLVVLGTSSWFTFTGGRQLACQQELVETNHRKNVGLWLRDHAQPHDSVFVECLGYIGYYSGLKMLDFPGLCAPEVVAIVRQHRMNWDSIVSELHPDWLVLRPDEATALAEHPTLNANYELKETFNILDKTEAANIHGRGYLAFDSIFLIFQRKPQP